MKKVINIIVFIISLGLVIGGFFCPPIGIIDGSVLTAIGELGILTLIINLPDMINKHNVNLTKGDFNIEIKDNKKIN